MTVSSDESADQLNIESGGTLLISSKTLSISDGTGTDLVNNGTLTNSNAVAPAPNAQIHHGSGAVYQHAMNGGAVPPATWDAASTCKITGVTSTLPTNLQQNFGHLEWNCTGQSASLVLGSVQTQGDFNVISTGSTPRDLILNNGSGSTNCSVGRNLNVSGGIVNMSSGGGTTALSLMGNFNLVGGNFTETGSGSGHIHFNGTQTQTYHAAGTVSQTIHFTINAPATLQMNLASTAVTGAGDFTLMPGASLGIRSADGINQSGTSGHIRVSGNRMFPAGASYVYNGSVAQSTGDGLPPFIFSLSVDNPLGITLGSSHTVSGTLSLLNGCLNTLNNIITIGNSTVQPGQVVRQSGWVNGKLVRWLSSSSMTLDMPIGSATHYRGLSTDFAGSHGGGTLTGWCDEGYPGNYGLPITEDNTTCSTIGSGCWNLEADNGLQNAPYTLQACASGFTGVNDHTKLRLAYRGGPSQAWSTPGSHVPPGGTISQPIVSRNGLQSFGQYTIISPPVNPLPVSLLSFEVREVSGDAQLKWSTATEKNSDYFVVERSNNGNEFEALEQISAAGNSQSVRVYSCTDPNPFAGTSYYRLKQVDRDGRTEYFGPRPFVLGLKGDAHIQSVSVAPNPVASESRLHVETSASGEWTMQIFNSRGMIVVNENLELSAGKNVVPMDFIDRLQSGKYNLRLTSDNDEKTTSFVRL